MKITFSKDICIYYLNGIYLTIEMEKKMKKVFVIGDSISMHYGPYLESKLKGKFGYGRKTGKEGFLDLDNPMGQNNGDSSMVVDYLKRIRDLALCDFDLVLINCGLHDIKTTGAGRQIEPLEYEKNLREICKIVDEIGKPMVWMTTTPVNDDKHAALCSAFGRYNLDVLKYNEISKKVMKENDIPVIDLYTLMEPFMERAYIDHVHFIDEYRKMQSDLLYSFIENYFKGE